MKIIGKSDFVKKNIDEIADMIVREDEENKEA
jgi:hypothetical protein